MSEKNKNNFYSFIGLARKAGAIAPGEAPAGQSIKRRKAGLVLLAEDASDNTKKKIESVLYQSNIPLICFGEKEKYGNALGRTSFSVIAVTEQHFSEKIKEMIDQYSNNDDTMHGGGFIEQTKNI